MKKEYQYLLLIATFALILWFIFKPKEDIVQNESGVEKVVSETKTKKDLDLTLNLKKGVKAKAEVIELQKILNQYTQIYNQKLEKTSNFVSVKLQVLKEDGDFGAQTEKLLKIHFAYSEATLNQVQNIYFADIKKGKFISEQTVTNFKNSPYSWGEMIKN